MTLVQNISYFISIKGMCHFIMLLVSCCIEIEICYHNMMFYLRKLTNANEVFIFLKMKNLSFLGTRFRPLSLELPKPLFPVAGYPIIYHHIEACSKVRIQNNFYPWEIKTPKKSLHSLLRNLQHKSFKNRQSMLCSLPMLSRPWFVEPIECP